MADHELPSPVDKDGNPIPTVNYDPDGHLYRETESKKQPSRVKLGRDLTRAKEQELNQPDRLN